LWQLTKSNQKKVSSRTQIQIKKVRDGVLILPSNRYRLILETSALNFELKSADEQDVIIDSFQNLLNSLPCPIQILVRVRKIEVDNYIEQILSSKGQESEKVYKDHIQNYAEFIQRLVTGNKILTRHFYIVVPLNKFGKQQDFEIVKGELNMFENVISKGLEKLGMKVRRLDSLEVLNLFYNFYNPLFQTKLQPLRADSIDQNLAFGEVI
jgi:hypothetical protein